MLPRPLFGNSVSRKICFRQHFVSQFNTVTEMSQRARDYPIRAVPLAQVAIQDDFWKPRIDTAIEVTIPYDLQMCEESGRIDNFDKAAGIMPGAHEGRYFNDSDVFKVIEGAAYALQLRSDPALEAYLDGLIEKIAAAQEDDGYLYTARTIDPVKVPEGCGPDRWSNLRVNHELYNVGHMYESAVAYFEATGKRRYLDVVLMNANLIDSVFGPGKLRDVPGHQEIEIGLIRLYRLTEDEKYLRLAKYFLDERGRANGRGLYGDYCQDHLPVTEQNEAVGHTVRAGYMYSAMTEIAALYGDSAYRSAVQTLWDNVASKKLAITGGIGALHEGESFGENYELPTLTAYNETCAAQAHIYWNHKLFLLTGHGKYIDVMERTLYNGFLAGVGLDGRSFFYVNPLACDGQYRFNRDDNMTRQPWFITSCCPTNIVRLLPALSQYIYARRDNDIFVNLFIASEAKMNIDGNDIVLRQEANYPWDGRIRLHIEPMQPTNFVLKLRLPGFARQKPVPSDLYRYLEDDTGQISLTVDGMTVEAQLEDGYISIARQWHRTVVVELELPLPIRRVLAHPAVDALRGKVALERGPIVYAVEAADNRHDVLELALGDSGALAAEHHPDLLGGITTIHGTGLDGAGNPANFMAIPYYAWGHRGAGEMTVWLNRKQTWPALRLQ